MGGFSSAAAAAKEYKILASDVVLGEDATERSTLSTSLVKIVAIRVPVGVVPDTTARVVMRIKSTATATATGRIYKNGVALGSVHSNNTTSYVTYTEDLVIGSAGDDIEIYLYSTSAAYEAWADLLSIRGDMDEIGADWDIVYP
jgi:hypothetical protein